MKKYELKTGMNIYFKNGKIATVLLNTKHGDIYSETNNNDPFTSTWNNLKSFPESLCDWKDTFEIYMVTNPIGRSHYLCYKEDNEEVVWKKTENTILTLDGVEYSESTLRSLIKKATS